MSAPLEDCLICFRRTPVYRKDIKPYLCTCNYPVHRVCFERWRATGTRRTCLICQVEEPAVIVPYVEENVRIVQYVEPPRRRCLHRCCDSIYTVLLVIAFIVWHFWVFHIRR